MAKEDQGGPRNEKDVEEMNGKGGPERKEEREGCGRGTLRTDVAATVGMRRAES
jgi:hypothetical protein